MRYFQGTSRICVIREIILALIYVMSQFSLSKFVTIAEYISLISTPPITYWFAVEFLHCKHFSFITDKLALQQSSAVTIWYANIGQ